MAKHAGGGGYSVNGAAMQRPYSLPKWVQTPKWHWRYWFGYRMRIWLNAHDTMLGEYDAEWVYRTFGQHARAVLEEQANGRRYNQGGEAQAAQRSPNYISGHQLH